ncbi:hypothetical protein OIO90_005290 [Microbotryomycetes sp. JL221]|nr:hypothetical protein OIO90_005290 [Microbotryomycetes sp. JL221]
MLPRHQLTNTASTPLFSTTFNTNTNNNRTSSSSPTAHSSPLFPSSPPRHSPQQPTLSPQPVSSSHSPQHDNTLSLTPQQQQQPKQDFVTLPAPPHLVDSTTLSNLPLDHLVSLVTTLSRQQHELQQQLSLQAKQTQAIEHVCLQYISQAQLDRTKLRAQSEFYQQQQQTTLKSNEYRIPLLANTVDKLDPATQLNLNLDDLADAISHNPFASPTASDTHINEDTRSISKLSIHSQSEPASSLNTETILPDSRNRTRHASISRRWLGSLSGSSSSAILSTSPTTRTKSDNINKQQQPAHRTDKVESNPNDADQNQTKTYREWLGWKHWSKTNLNAVDKSITTTTNEPNMTTQDNQDSQNPTEQSPTPSIADTQSQVELTASINDNNTTSSSDASLAPSPPTQTRNFGTTASVALSMPATAVTLSPPRPDLSFRRASTPSRSLVSTVAVQEEEQEDVQNQSRPTIQLRRASTGMRKSSHQLALNSGTRLDDQSLKGTLTRTLVAGTSTLSNSSTPMTRSLSEGRHNNMNDNSSTTTTTTTTSTNSNSINNKLTRYTPFASTALSTPSPQVSLSLHSTSISTSSSTQPVFDSSTSLLHSNKSTKKLISPTITTKPNSTTTTTTNNTTTSMELSTILDETAPPTLVVPSLLRRVTSTEQEQEQEDETSTQNPMIDRYGFIHDVRTGMKLLRQAQKRQQQQQSSLQQDDEDFVEQNRNELDKDRVNTMNDSLMKESRQNQIELEIKDLKQSMGIETCSNVELLKDSTRLFNNDDDDLKNKTASNMNHSLSSARNPTANKQVQQQQQQQQQTQLMKRLFKTLNKVSNDLDLNLKSNWDSFIQKRQIILLKQQQQQQNSTNVGIGSTSLNQMNDSNNNNLNHFNERQTKENNYNKQEENELNNKVDNVEHIWFQDLIGISQMGSMGKSGKQDWFEFKQLIKKGIPIDYRPKIWAECSGANEAREPGLYQDLLAKHKGQDNPCLNQIDMDYCQGMNNLTATLLLTHPSEEDAFWVLVCIIEKILPSDYYTSHLLVSQADQRVLKDLILDLLPDVSIHLEQLGVELPAICFGWFLSLFTDALPIQTLLRVWDLLFVMGTVILFRVTVAIFQMNKNEILECDSAASLYALMRNVTGHLYQVDKLIKLATEDLRSAIKDRQVSKLRSKHVADLQVELGLVATDDV